MAERKTYAVQTLMCGKWVPLHFTWGVNRSYAEGYFNAVKDSYPRIEVRMICEQTGEVLDHIRPASTNLNAVGVEEIKAGMERSADRAVQKAM